MGCAKDLICRLDVAAGDGIEPAGGGVDRVIPVGTGIGKSIAGIVLSRAATAGGVRMPTGGTQKQITIDRVQHRAAAVGVVGVHLDRQRGADQRDIHALNVEGAGAD